MLQGPGRHMIVVPKNSVLRLGGPIAFGDFFSSEGATEVERRQLP